MTRSLIYDLKWSINCQGCGTWIDSKNGLSFIISAPSLELYHFRKFFISDISFPMKKKLDCRIIAGELDCRGILRPVRKTEKRQQQQQQQKTGKSKAERNKRNGKACRNSSRPMKLEMEPPTVIDCVTTPSTSASFSDGRVSNWMVEYNHELDRQQLTPPFFI